MVLATATACGASVAADQLASETLRLGPTSPSTAGTGPANPSTASSQSPTHTLAAGDTPRKVKIASAGDFLIHRSVWNKAIAYGGSVTAMNFEPMIADVEPVISRADFAICHLDTPLAPAHGPFASDPVFSTAPQIVKTGIKAAGFDTCSTVSNHALDGGFAGIERTIGAFEAVRVGHSGTARSAAEAAIPPIFNVKGVKIAHLAYTDALNGNKPDADKPWSVNMITADKIIADAKAARARGAEIVVVSLHSGTEDVAAPNDQQKNVAHALAASGQVNLIHGISAHVVQPVAKIGNMWVAFGHGNLLTGQFEKWHRNNEGLITQFTFTEQPDGSFAVTKGVGHPTFDDQTSVHIFDLVKALKRDPHDARMREAYYNTRKAVFMLGAEKDGFTIPTP